MEKKLDFDLSDEKVQRWREKIRKARPYTEDDPEPAYFDWCEDYDRSEATDAMELLQAAGLWTAEDEAVAFGPHPAPEGAEPAGE